MRGTLEKIYVSIGQKVLNRLEKETTPSKKTLRMISLLQSLYAIIG